MDLATAHNFRELGLNSKTFVLYFNTEVLLYGKYENRTQRSRHLLSIFILVILYLLELSCFHNDELSLRSRIHG